MISIIIPANNEEDYIADCLEALLAQVTDRTAEVIVAANACTDKTSEIVHSYQARFLEKGWAMQLLDIEAPGKPNALNIADTASSGMQRIYLDADVIMSPTLFDNLCVALDADHPVYASGRLKLANSMSWVTRSYGRIWAKLPFMTHGVPGAGLFAVNAAARGRWSEFPEIISDDTFVRLHFAPHERVLVNSFYEWPLVAGLTALIRVRRRQNIGVKQVFSIYPELAKNSEETGISFARAGRLVVADPLGFLVYLSVVAAAKIPSKAGNKWSRGR